MGPPEGVKLAVRRALGGLPCKERGREFEIRIRQQDVRRLAAQFLLHTFDAVRGVLRNVNAGESRR